jgi:polyhydroxyalkanoate synthesis regulator phasin
MAKKTTKQDELEATEKESRSRFYETARKLLLAGAGAVALAQDEAEQFLERLVERGEIAEKDARKLVREMTEKRRKNAGGELEKRMEDLLDRMNVPSKSDIEALSDKIATLTEKVEDLKKA